jgi:hypothetical protein
MVSVSITQSDAIGGNFSRSSGRIPHAGCLPPIDRLYRLQSIADKVPCHGSLGTQD